MALDMKLSDSSLTSEIHHDEESFLTLIQSHDLPCPILNRIWERIYDDPRISNVDCARIVKELASINRYIETQRPQNIDSAKWAGTFAKLTRFFTEAAKTKSNVECISD